MRGKPTIPVETEESVAGSPEEERGAVSKPERPRPKHPFKPGPLISKPDEATILAVPLPPALKKERRGEGSV
jgi:hypothetical protein